MHLAIQVPCLDEAEVLPTLLASLPRELEGFDRVSWVVIDDGSSDSTSDVASQHGVDVVVRFKRNRGLASAFQAGIEACIDMGADIIVNIDADNQYPADQIERIVSPVREGHADMVIGDRGLTTHPDFSRWKSWLQRAGSKVVGLVAGTQVADATSGFRAIGREAACNINITSSFTYTLESIVQLQQKGFVTKFVPVRVNSFVRESRLFRSNTQYILRALRTLVRLSFAYRPIKFIGPFALAAVALGVAAVARFLILAIGGDSSGHIQSLVLGAASIIVGVQLAAIGLLADAVRRNRGLTEQLLARSRRSGGSGRPSS